MQLSLVTLVLGLAAFGSAQNQGRPAPNGACCVANTNLKQDVCTATNGQQGRCVPGGNNCGYHLVPHRLDFTDTLH